MKKELLAMLLRKGTTATIERVTAEFGIQRGEVSFLSEGHFHDRAGQGSLSRGGRAL